MLRGNDASSAPQLEAFLVNITQDDDITWPRTIQLNFAWSVGVRSNRSVDESVRYALAWQLARPLIGHATVDAASGTFCQFSSHCSSTTAQQVNSAFVNTLLSRRACVVALFHQPVVVTFWIKDKIFRSTKANKDYQRWRAWQCCTNCVAAKHAATCDHWRLTDHADLTKGRGVNTMGVEWQVVSIGTPSQKDRDCRDHVLVVRYLESIDIDLSTQDNGFRARWARQERESAM